MFGLFKSKPRYLADIEYWVYVPEEKLPDQEALMEFVLRGHVPSKTPAAAGPSEGILFSDIRLSIALVLRSRNPHVFRPDLMTPGVEISAERLEALADSKALIKVRYTSEEPLADTRHVKLVSALALAAGTLGNSSLVYDQSAGILWPLDAFWLKVVGNPKDPRLHVRALWKHAPNGGGTAETRGLVKVGLREFETKEMNLDEQVLITAVVEEAACRLFEMAEYPPELIVDAFDDAFRLEFDPRSKGAVQASVARIRTS